MNMKNKATLVWVILFLGFLVSAPLMAQRPMFGSSEGEDRRILLDYAVFNEPSKGLLRLEVYHQVYNHAMVFKNENGVWKARYTLEVVIREDNGDQVGRDSTLRDIVVASELKANSRSDYRIGQSNFWLSHDKYEVTLRVKDLNGGVLYHRERKVKLERFEGKYPKLSDVEFVHALGSDTAAGNGFVKGESLVIVPSLRKSFGGHDTSSLYYYLEIEKGNDYQDTLIMESILSTRSAGMIYRDTIWVGLKEQTTRQLRQVSLKGYKAGEYTLEVNLRGRRYKRIDTKIRDFVIEWTQDALLQNDFKTALEQLSLIAEADELDGMKKLTVQEERMGAFDQFWLQRDPSPGTPENEVKNEFYRRIAVANRNFAFMRRDGWRTDRGRVFVRHGEPDQVDDYPVSVESAPYQEWHYYQNGRYRKFTFVDETGDGDFKLVYPYDGLNQTPEF